jgi:hypothetical protein
MCPACIATAALLAAKASSAGGLTALVAKRLHTKTARKKNKLAAASRSAESAGEG